MGDVSILRIVVLGLVVALLVLLVGAVVLLMQDKSIPGTLETLGGMIVTGLLGLLAPSREVTRGEHEA